MKGKGNVRYEKFEKAIRKPCPDNRQQPRLSENSFVAAFRQTDHRSARGVSTVYDKLCAGDKGRIIGGQVDDSGSNILCVT
jgi:hypothetical protein